MTDQTDVQDRPLYLITVGDTEDSRYLPTRFGPPEDPDGIQRYRAMTRMWELQEQGADPQAWLLTADQLADVDAGRLVLQDLPPDAFERLPDLRAPADFAGPPNLSHLVHPVVRVRGEARTIVAAFTDAADALAWADMLTTTDTEAGTRYEVPGVDAPTEAELAPYLQQARDTKGGESE
jgi:hypothetical protein